MKTRIIKPLVMLSAVATLSSARAEDTPAAPARNEAISEAKSDARLEAQAGKPDKPEKPERPKLNRADIKDSVDEIKTSFRAKAEDYVRKQKELVAELKSAKGEEKTKIREKLKDLKEQWKEDQPNVRELVSDLKEKIDREKGKGKGKGGGKPRD
jgi:gas vesicle protein